MRLKEFLFPLIILTGCSLSDKKPKDEIIDQTIDSVFALLHEFRNLKGEIRLLHYERYPNKARIRALEFILPKWEANQKKTILGELARHVRDSVIYAFDDGAKFGDIIISEKIVTEEEAWSSKYFGWVSLSDSIEKDGEGCYYFEVECGENCSCGFLVTTYFDHKWKIRKIDLLWSG